MPCFVLFIFVNKHCKTVCHCSLRFSYSCAFKLIAAINTFFVSVLKSETYIDKQNRQLSFLVKHDIKMAKFESEVKAHEKRNSCSQYLNKK